MSHPNGLVTFQGFLDLWEQKKKKKKKNVELESAFVSTLSAIL